MKEDSVDFNKKITNRILVDLQNVKKQNLSCQVLESNIRQNIASVDSTFPIQIKNVIESILSKTEDHIAKQYCATLNTSSEGTYDETVQVDNLFDYEIAFLEEYCSSSS